MAQEYNMRYPLIDGQGNLGSQESNDMVSASRYTSCRPSVYADLMFNDYGKNVIPQKPTYNDEFTEPVILPSLFPNALVNGKEAIGLSMSHNSLPNNLSEVSDGIIEVIKDDNLSLDELMQIIKGPDFPLGGVVINSKDIKEAFRTGHSSVSLKVRGDYTVEENKIIFTSIPYRTYRDKIKEQILKYADALEPYIEDFKDESNIGYNKLIFILQKGADQKKAISKLFEYTDLQTTLSYNMNYIVNGTPRLCSLLDLIHIYIDHQNSIMIKAAQFDKEKAEKRKHILEGLIKAIEVIDEIISLIKNSSNSKEAKNKLINNYDFSEEQAQAILDMKLAKLSKLDEEELKSELIEKINIIKEKTRVIEDSSYRNEILIKNLTELKNKYGDNRRTKLLDIKEDKFQENEEEKIEEFYVYIQNGEVKKTPNKPASIKGAIKTDSSKILYIFCANGKVYRETPKKKATIEDKPLLVIPEDYNEQYIFFATQKGYIKSTKAEEYTSLRMKSAALKLDEDDKVIAVIGLTNSRLQAKTNKNKTYDVSIALNPPSGRNTKGKKIGKLDLNENIISLTFN